LAQSLRDRLNRRLLLAWGAAAAATIIVAALIYAALTALPAIRVGDGSEYYALERTITLSQRPYMTEAGWAGYEAMIETNEVQGVPPLDWLKNAFTGLRTTSGADFNHFWLYPAAAAAAGFVGDRVGMGITPHAHFMLLHALMLAALLALCYWTDRWKGVAAALIITCASPVLWFINKVHTEFATVVLSTGAIALAAKRYWAAAGFLLALTATQNISFAIPAFVCCVIALYQMSTETRSGLRACVDSLFLSGSAIFALLHPSYYFFRFGGITPQLITFGADTSSISPLTSIQYVLDPDIGLLPNWPLGLIIVVVAAALAAKNYRDRPQVAMTAFILSYVLAAMAAQSATGNINSGATINVARYGLWYICLLYPCIIYIARQSKEWRAPTFVAAVTALLLLIIFNVREYPPKKGESYDSPTRVSRVVYRYAPWLWTPAPEVFHERYSGIGESAPLQRPAVVLGPGCIRALFIPGDAGQKETKVRAYPQGACGMSDQQFQDAVEKRFETLPAGPTYFKLTSEELAVKKQPVPQLTLDSPVGPDGIGPYLREGWSASEPWGTWSIGDRSTLQFLASPSAKNLRITVSAFLGGTRTKAAASLSINGTKPTRIEFGPNSPQPSVFTLPLPVSSEPQVYSIEILHDNIISPADAGVSADTRELSLGIIGLEVVP